MSDFSKQFSAYIELIQKLDGDIEWSSRTVSGTIVIDESSIPLLETLQECGALDDYFRVGNNSLDSFKNILDSKNSGKKLSIKLTQNREFNIYKNLDELLRIRQNKYGHPEEFYLSDEQFSLGDESIPSSVNTYLNIIRFYDILDNIADYKFEKLAKKHLLFFSGKKLNLSVDYSVEGNLDLNNIGELETFAETTPHKEQKVLLIKKTITDLVNDSIDKDSRFVFLLNNLDLILKRVNDDYTLFISEFSFDKIRKEAEERKLKYTQKINDVFTEVQNKILVIPAALLLASSQISASETLTFKAVAVFISALLFSLMMHFLLRNQESTLMAIKEDIDSQSNELKHEYQSIYPKLKSIFDFLEKRYIYQSKVLKFIFFAVWGWLLITAMVIIVQTESLYNCIKNLW